MVDGFSTGCRQGASSKLWEPVGADHVHFTLAVESVSGGEEAFNKWCNHKLIAPDNVQFASGYLRSFARLNGLLKEFQRPEYGHFHRWFETFLDRSWSYGYASRIKRIALSAEQRVGLEEAARSIGCKPWAVAFLIDSKVLPGKLFPVPPSGKLAGVVRRDELEKFGTRLSETVPLHSAAEQLHLTPTALEREYLLGLVSAHRGPLTDGSQEIRFHQSDLDRYLMGSNETPSAACPDELPIQYAEQILGISDPVLESLIEAGMLEVRGGSVLWPTDFLQKFAWEFQAARTVGLPIPAFRRWVEWGRFRPVVRVGATALYRRNDLELFRPANRCSVKQATAILGLSHPQQVHRKYLRTALLKPIAGPGYDPGTELILSHDNVTQIAKSLQTTKANRPEVTLHATSTPDAGDELICTADAAQMLGMSIGAFQRAFRATDLLVPRMRESGGGKNLFSRVDVEQFVRGRTP